MYLDSSRQKKRKTEGMYPKIENALLQWVNIMKRQGVSIYGDIMERKGVMLWKKEI